ncbi:MAG: 3-phosphoserine/phosphohydroxythreonine transaminase [Burkholderiales bacterium]|nr:3-phosphoserine/phosphohydroxythreonine transaminase [Burkholderiales bacterium]
MLRAYNFGAGPAMLPTEVLQRARDELFDWQGTGVSVMEIGHRTGIYQDMLAKLEQKLRKLMHIPSNYKVLFLQGGAQGLFSLIPMNLTLNNKDVDYLVSGIWSERAAKYAKKYGNVNIVTTASLTSIPDSSTWNLNNNAAYAYYCPNETINGIRCPEFLNPNSVPLVADMTSSVLSEVIDVSKFGIIFAAAQKNLGIAGITLLIIRDDLLDQALDSVPEVFNFKIQAAQKSCLNTPATYPLYMMDLMVDWTINQGGVTQMAAVAARKSQKLYNYIDQSNGFYINTIEPKYRSWINIPFLLPNDELLELFLVEAAQHNLKYLKGHILVGGARASLYNAMPESGVDALIDFMQNFAAKY